MKENKNFKIFWGNILRKLRYQHHLTQYEVAEMLHISRQTYSNLECGKRHPSPEVIAILSDLYDVDLYNYVVSLMPQNYVAEHNEYKLHIKGAHRKKNKLPPDEDDYCNTEP